MIVKRHAVCVCDRLWMVSYAVPPPGTGHGPNIPVRPPRQVVLTLQNGSQVEAQVHDQMQWATGWRIRCTWSDGLAMTVGGWFPAEAAESREA